MKNLTVMLKPASSLCNLRCKYCFYVDVSSHRETSSFGVMQKETAEAVINHLFSELAPGDALHLAFQGGEPLLAGPDWFRHVISCVEQRQEKVSVTYALQTNGTLIDDDWCELFRTHSFLLGVSLDGTQQNHNFFRPDAAGKGTFRKVMAAISLLRAHDIEFNILTTLTNPLARHPKQVWDVIVANDFRYVQFTPCLAPLQATVSDPWALTPDRFSSFYQTLFQLWKAAFFQGNYYSIKLFDDLISLLAFGRINACGLTGQCAPQLIVEADGSVYPCDFYTLDEWRVGKLADTPLSTLYTSPKMTAFRQRPRSRALCHSCPYLPICHGGCHRMQQHVCYGEADAQCGYRVLLDAILPDVNQIAGWQRKKR